MPGSQQLTTSRATALYIGALLGPSLLLLPGLAASLAGPASILAWVGLLLLSAMLARVFTALGTRFPAGNGVVAYTTAGLGVRSGKAVAWCFVSGVVFGAPVVCLIGGIYVAVLFGGGKAIGVAVAALLLVVVVALTLSGARASSSVQLALVVLLVVLVAGAVVGSAHAADARNWHPFTPHGWSAVGSAASVLMLSFVGWEAIAPMVSRLADPKRQLPRVITIAFAATTVLYLALAVSTVAVLGSRAGTAVPLSDLLRVAIGKAGPAIAALAALALTLAATNAYLSGAAALIAQLRAPVRRSPSKATAEPDRPGALRGRDYRLQFAIAAVGLGMLAAVAAGIVNTAELVAVPTTLFVTVYLGSTAAAARILSGGTRVLAAMACVAVAFVLLFAGWSLLAAVVVIAAAMLRRPELPTGHSDGLAVRRC